MLHAQYTKLGDPREVLELIEGVHRPLKVQEARIEVLAAPIHNSDLLQMQGIYGNKPELPAIPGGEGVGKVVELGANVDHLQVGQTVLLSGLNSWSQQVIAPATGLVAVPAEADIDQLSMLLINPASALLMLTTFVDLKPGDWLIQSAANSSVGSLVIQLSKMRGIKTVNVVRRENVVNGLKRLGGDVILLDGPDLPEAVSAATSGANIKLALDAVGGQTFDRLVKAVGDGGTIVSYSTSSLDPISVRPIDLIFRQIDIRGFWLTDWLQRAEASDVQKLFSELIEAVSSEKLHTKIDSVFPLEQLQQAVERAMSDGRSGKVILRP